MGPQPQPSVSREYYGTTQPPESCDTPTPDMKSPSPARGSMDLTYLPRGLERHRFPSSGSQYRLIRISQALRLSHGPRGSARLARRNPWPSRHATEWSKNLT